MHTCLCIQCNGVFLDGSQTSQMYFSSGGQTVPSECRRSHRNTKTHVPRPGTKHTVPLHLHITLLRIIYFMGFKQMTQILPWNQHVCYSTEKRTMLVQYANLNIFIRNCNNMFNSYFTTTKAIFCIQRKPILKIKRIFF